MDQPNDSVQQDTQNPAGEAETRQDTHVEQQSDAQSDKPNLEKVNKELFARAKHAEDELKKIRGEAANNPSSQTSAPQADDIDTVLQLRSEGYSDKEIRDLRSLSKKYSKPLVELLRDDLIRSGVEAQRAKIKVEQATPAPSPRSGIVGGKSFSQMTPAERAQNFSFDAWKARKGGRG